MRPNPKGLTSLELEQIVFNVESLLLYLHNCTEVNEFLSIPLRIPQMFEQFQRVAAVCCVFYHPGLKFVR